MPHASLYLLYCTVSIVNVNLYVASSYPLPVELQVIVFVPLDSVVVQLELFVIAGLNVT